MAKFDIHMLCLLEGADVAAILAHPRLQASVFEQYSITNNSILYLVSEQPI